MMTSIAGEQEMFRWSNSLKTKHPLMPDEDYGGLKASMSQKEN